ncbi:hypothetical protein FSP39_012512 [Pinctada imbricata]|uniref:TIR domain-containing protein n=1 Tax=Pinctada imbricata TaxID=66713 RepID=A0AA88YEE2_PINIB|nr:hypothetical protein FSP39_012512 [Pinctada imbricata]
MDKERESEDVCLLPRRRRQHHVLISHHSTLRKDVEFVLSLREVIQQDGFKIFSPQEDYDDQLTLQQNFERAVDSCCKTIVVMSHGYLSSKGCRKELDILYKRLHKRDQVHSLESSDPKVECAYHERDFEYGRSIVENIKYCVENSDKVVIVLTKEFLKSEWTRYETEIAQYRSIWNPNELVIIPVMLTPCDIPERLANITYLDATDTEQVWWNRLLKTVNSPSKEFSN